MPPSLILASASPSRRELLIHAGLQFDIEPAGLDEEEITRSLGSRAAPQELASTLAEMKAVKVSSRHPDA
ncbi:MAG TPA: Maf family protein, partial [Reyranella sp.]|nr:Maf family protein [Reyranella sp.]